VRFGLAVSTSARDGADPVGDVRHAEALGFDLVTLSDHLVGSHPTFETWTLLTWLAAGTERIALAPTVLGLPYRHPAVLAKMAESLHRLSGGRLILGLGGGGNDREFEAFGLDVRRPGEKVDALGEEIEILRGLWRETPFSFRGKHFHVDSAEVEPKPEPPIPIWLGTYGPRALELTGRLADGWNPSMPYAPPDVAVRMREQVLAAAEAAGRDPSEIVCSYNVPIVRSERPGGRPGVPVASPDEMAERIASFVRDGFTTVVFWLGGGAEARERMASEVLPAVRELAR